MTLTDPRFVYNARSVGNPFVKIGSSVLTSAVLHPYSFVKGNRVNFKLDHRPGPKQTPTNTLRLTQTNPNPSPNPTETQRGFEVGRSGLGSFPCVLVAFHKRKLAGRNGSLDQSGRCAPRMQVQRCAEFRIPLVSRPTQTNSRM